MRDENGYYWYKGRKDDLINSAGYKIGPSEVEESLMSHPFISDVAVVGKPDRERGEVVMAFVIVADGVATDEVTRETLQMHVKNNLSAYKYPRFIKFMESLPMTSSGKIKRDTLRQLAADHST